MELAGTTTGQPAHPGRRLTVDQQPAHSHLLWQDWSSLANRGYTAGLKLSPGEALGGRQQPNHQQGGGHSANQGAQHRYQGVPPVGMALSCNGQQLMNKARS